LHGYGVLVGGSVVGYSTVCLSEVGHMSSANYYNSKVVVVRVSTHLSGYTTVYNNTTSTVVQYTTNPDGSPRLWLRPPKFVKEAPHSVFGAWGHVGREGGFAVGTSALSSPFLGKSRVLPQRCYCCLLEGNQYILQSIIPSQMP